MHRLQVVQEVAIVVVIILDQVNQGSIACQGELYQKTRLIQAINAVINALPTEFSTRIA